MKNKWENRTRNTETMPKRKEEWERVITTLTAVKVFILELCCSWHPTELDTVRRGDEEDTKQKKREEECSWQSGEEEEELKAFKTGGNYSWTWKKKKKIGTRAKKKGVKRRREYWRVDGKVAKHVLWACFLLKTNGWLDGKMNVWLNDCMNKEIKNQLNCWHHCSSMMKQQEAPNQEEPK